MTLTGMFTETQRDIIANNQQYNNRFNYAVSTRVERKYFLINPVNHPRTTSSRPPSTLSSLSFLSICLNSFKERQTSIFSVSSYCR